MAFKNWCFFYETALDVAKKNGHQIIVKCLEDY